MNFLLDVAAAPLYLAIFGIPALILIFVVAAIVVACLLISKHIKKKNNVADNTAITSEKE